MVFMTLREQFVTLQVCGVVDLEHQEEYVFEGDVIQEECYMGNVSEGMVAWAASVQNESIVDVTGVLVKPEVPIKSCSIMEVELKMKKRRFSGLVSTLSHEKAL